VQEGLRQDDELSHDGDERDFCGLSCGDRLVVLRLDVAVEAGRCECRHVDRASQERPAALDALVAPPFSGLS